MHDAVASVMPSGRVFLAGSRWQMEKQGSSGTLGYEAGLLEVFFCLPSSSDSRCWRESSTTSKPADDKAAAWLPLSKLYSLGYPQVPGALLARGAPGQAAHHIMYCKCALALSDPAGAGLHQCSGTVLLRAIVAG
jgi:hypothetical protein